MKTDQFLCGVIEGYYGRPWSFYQRKILFQNCLRFGLNTYMYAPKDDEKHRSRWRDLYNEQEVEQLTQLIHFAKQNQIDFIYALSPGLDIRYSSIDDFNALKRKFHQLSNLGCEHWALLFDDIENEMCEEDKQHYSSFAHAQVSISNQLFHYLNQPKIFLFCPTEYCSRMGTPTMEKSNYLQTIGDGLHLDIGILWTGEKVVSRRITLSHLFKVKKVLKRRVTIWENLNANDYDQRRLYLGPFSGRQTNIHSEINGMLINPNCEFQLNFIPFYTLGQWFQSIRNNENYNVEKALDEAIQHWLPEFNRIKSANDYEEIIKIEDHSLRMNDDDSMKIHRMECEINTDLTIDHIRLLVQLFYLPYQHGPDIQQIYSNFYWLRFHSNSSHEHSNEWHHRANLFHNFAKNLSDLLQKLLKISNRGLLYEIYFYILDMNSTIDLCSKYLHWIDENEKCSSMFMSGDVEPWCIRGGLAGEFLNILPLGDFQSIIQSDVNSSSSTIVFIRPIYSIDRSSMYKLTMKMSYENQFDDVVNENSEMIGDKLIGGYLLSLSNNYENCFGIEDNEDCLCGFVLTIEESEKYDKDFQRKWIEELHRKYSNVDQSYFQSNEYPQWIYDQYSARIQFFIDFTLKIEKIFHIGIKLMKILVNQLGKKGCVGCHAIIDERNSLLHRFYLRLGFVDIRMIDENDRTILLAKQF